MSKNSQLKNLKKRKKQLAEKKRLSQRPTSLAYTGGKYRTEALVPLWLAAEKGIYEAFVVSRGRIYDPTVVRAIDSLIRKLRAAVLAPASSEAVMKYTGGNEEDLIIECIRSYWRNAFEEGARPATDDLIGVLRSILGSIEARTTAGEKALGYLRYLKGFLEDKVGFSVRLEMPQESPAIE